MTILFLTPLYLELLEKTLALLVAVRKRRLAIHIQEAIPALLAAGFAFSALCGTAQAQELESYTKPNLRPPVASSPYNSRAKGNYVLPGTFSSKGELPPLPKKEPVRMPPPPTQQKRALPDIRALPELSGAHSAETPQIFRAVTPSSRGAGTLVAPPQTGYTPRYRPAPAPLIIPAPADMPADEGWIALDAPAAPEPDALPVMEHVSPPPAAQRTVVVEQPAPVIPPLPMHNAPKAVQKRAGIMEERVTPAPPLPLHDAPLTGNKRTVVAEPSAPFILNDRPMYDEPVAGQKRTVITEERVEPAPPLPLRTEPLPDAPPVVQKRTVVMERVAEPVLPPEVAPMVTSERRIVTEQMVVPEIPPLPLNAAPAPVVVQKRTVVEDVPQPLLSAPVSAETPSLAPMQQRHVTEIVEIPDSETGKILEIPAETTLLMPVEPVQQQELSPASQAILDKTPSGIDSPKTVMRTPKPVILTRSEKPDGLDVRTHEALGLKIEVRKAPPNVAAFLQQGYDHLMAGNLSIAAGFYEEARRVAPKDENALFGIATTYQRMGRREEARDIYGELLAQNPSHREGLNNFMVLLADEAPLAAIDALEQLETENPDFSPIPAQLGSVYNRIGNYEMAARKLARALQLSPDNLAYKYNLAIAIDQLGDKKQASDLYMELIEAYNLGGVLPGDVGDIRNRVIFLNK